MAILQLGILRLFLWIADHIQNLFKKLLGDRPLGHICIMIKSWNTLQLKQYLTLKDIIQFKFKIIYKSSGYIWIFSLHENRIISTRKIFYVEMILLLCRKQNSFLRYATFYKKCEDHLLHGVIYPGFFENFTG